MKTDYELLIENPKALKRFCDLLIEHATVIGIEIEIEKISDSLRTQITAARACGLDTSHLLKHCRSKRHERLLVCDSGLGQLFRRASRRIICQGRNHIPTFN